jgi:transcriptional regulator with XRE-family HTH domain
MQLHDKIRQIREEKGLKLVDVYERIKEQFGPRAINYRTLQRIEAGETEPGEFSLYRISIGLNVKIKDLQVEENTLAKFIPHDKPQGHYDYPHTKARAIKLSTGKLKGLLPQKLILAAGAKTPIEKNIDPDNLKIYEKWVFGLKGQITCVVENEEYVIGKNDVVFFEAQNAHYFENRSAKSASCLVIYSPPYP